MHPGLEKAPPLPRATPQGQAGIGFLAYNFNSNREVSLLMNHNRAASSTVSMSFSNTHEQPECGKLVRHIRTHDTFPPARNAY
jgi:hypothetical protein